MIAEIDLFLASPADACQKGWDLMAEVAEKIGGEQLELFVGLPTPDPLAVYQLRLLFLTLEIAARRRRPSQRLGRMQCVIELRERIVIHPDEIPEEGDYPVHLRIKVEDAQPIKTKAPCSIFALASEAAAKQILSEFTLARHGEPDFEPPQETIHRKIIRDGDVTRHISMRVQETDEWAEKEKARRARQKLPKPPKQKFRIKKETA